MATSHKHPNFKNHVTLDMRGHGSGYPLGKILQVVRLPSGSVGKKSTCNSEDAREAVQSLGWKDPLEEEMATHFSIFAWRITRTEEPSGLQSIRSQRVR